VAAAQTIKVGCGEWGFRELDLPEHFRIARDLGFRTLEFGIGGGQAGRLPEEPSRPDIDDFRALARKHGVATPGCCLENDFTLPSPPAHAQMVERTLRQIRAARQCGASFVRLFAGFTPAAEMTESIWARMIDAFSQADQLCAELGLSIAVETHGRITMRDGAAHHEHTVSTEPAAARRLMGSLPWRIGVNYDPGNLKAVSPADRTYGLPLFSGRINYCHLKDWKRSGGGWVACAIGDDDLDYGALLPRVKFGGVHLIEYEPTEDVVDGIRRSLAYLERIGFAPELA
jgi:sugar phosphate isomerase/epimerase